MGALITQAHAASSVAQNDFGLELYKRLRETYPEKTNLMVSPLSAYLALSLVYNGADKATKAEIAGVLGSKGILVEALNKANAKLMKSLTSKRSGVELDIANALVANKGFSFKPAFSKTLRKAYQALIETKDFSDPKTAAFLDNWVKEKTHGKIEKISDKVTPKQRALLMNATYFKGTWETPFPEHRTEPGKFTKTDGKVTDVPMMHNMASFRYVKGTDYEAIELPYGKGEASLFALLPVKGKALRDFEKSLTPAGLEGIVKSLKSADAKSGNVSFPKWKSASDVEIDKVLAAMGMKTAFTDSANFSKMSAEPLAIDSASQKTFIEVNEKSTEAAATTVFGMRATGMPQVDFDVSFDRPFLYAIWDTATGTLLFLGALADPS